MLERIKKLMDMYGKIMLRLYFLFMVTKKLIFKSDFRKTIDILSSYLLSLSYINMYVSSA